jgi:hypothetical protein
MSALDEDSEFIVAPTLPLEFIESIGLGLIA